MSTIKLYLPLCWFYVNPLNLIKSKVFFRQNLLFYFIIELFIQANIIDIAEALVEVIMKIWLTLVFVGLVLWLNKTFYLYVQVASAILFCENVMTFFAALAVIWLTASDNVISYYILGIIITWCYAIVTFVLQKVLLVDIYESIAISLGYFMLTYGGAYGVAILLL